MSMKINGGEKKKKPAAGRGGARQQDQGKNDGGTITVVLKLGIYCDACADKATKSVKGFPGVESAKVDAGSGELTVVGKVDPSKLRDHVAKKTKKHVDLVSPTKKPDVVDKKPVDTKAKELEATTVVLKISLCCQGCIGEIQKTIWKIKGVDNVAIDTEKDLVTVKGTMDAKALPGVLREKMNREVEVVQPKKDDGEGKKKKGGEGSSEEAKKKNAATVAPAETAKPVAAAEFSTIDYYYGRYYYRDGVAHATQLLSEENPNACSIM